MNKRIKKKWVDALRSGEYSQCKGRLRDGDGGYCCLGVLTALYQRETNGTGCWYFTNGIGDVVDNGVLADAVMEWAGLRDDNPLLGDRSSTYYNDSEQLPFGEIADLIEEHL